MGDSSGTRIRLCGRFELAVDGERIAGRLPAGQAQVALAYLIAHRDRPADRAELIDVIWPRDLPKDPQGDLRPILSRLRRALDPASLEGRERLQLSLPEPVSIDVEEAARLIDEARAAAEDREWERARARSSAARELLSGGFLPGQDADWIEARRGELAELELEALELEARCGIALGGGGLRDAERAGRELIARAPYREAAYRILMEVLAADGNPAEALRVYDELRRTLRDELGTSPAPELQYLHGRLLAGEQPGAPPAAAPPSQEPAKRSPLPPALSPQERGAFVGREAELGVLGAAWRRARAGGRELVVLAGDPGIGKTRLAAEFAVLAHEDGTVLHASCPQEAVLPYQPIVEALRHYVLTHPLEDELERLGPGAAELGLLIPEVREALPAPGDSRPEDPETRRYMMFDAVVALVEAASERAPILLVLDDLHWADQPTLQLLRHLVGSPRRASLLVLGTYREAEVATGEPLAELLAELRPAQRFERIRLRGLDEQEVGALISFHAGSEAPEALLRTVHRGTDGNPFFVEEVMRHLIESGALFERGGRWVSALTVDEIGVPDGVEEVLLSRLGRLSEPSVTALRNAAVLGRGFSFASLAAMADFDEETLIGALEEALAAQLVVERSRRGEAGYEFTHALVREALYRGLGVARRQRLHAEAARAIESGDGVHGDAEVASLALHHRLADRAGDPAKAVEYSLRAGQRARELLAWDEAALHWEGAVELLDRAGTEPELRSRLLVGLADMMVVVGDVGRQIAFLERALAVCEGIADAERGAQVHSRLGMAHSLLDSIYAEFLDVPRAFRHFDAAREVLERGPVRAARGHLETGVATAHTYGLRIGDGIEAAQRGMEIADELGDEPLWIGAAEAYGWHKIIAGELGEGLGATERAFELAAERRRPFLAWMGSNIAGQLTWGLGDPAGAQAFFERALALPYIERTTHRQTLADGIGRCHASRGEIAEARQLLSDAKPAWFTHSLKPLVELWEGSWEDVERLAGEVLATSRRTGNRWDEWAAEHLAARVLSLRGDHAAAAEPLERALAIVVDGGAAYFEMWVRPDLAVTLAEVGRLEEARAQVGRCREILAAGEDWRGRAGHVDAAEAAVLASGGDLDGAANAFTRALGAFDRHELRCDEAEATYRWGLALARGGEARGAAEKLDAALELHRRHEAGEARLERVERERRSLSG